MTRLLGALLGATLAFGAHAHDSHPYEALIARLQAAEGFRPLPYRDSRGVLTVAYGRNLRVGFTRAEGLYLLRSMLARNEAALVAHWPSFSALPLAAREAVLEMVYNLGPGGVLGFRKMRAALEAGDFERAADEVLDSLWARQTPARAKRVAEALRAL